MEETNMETTKTSEKIIVFCVIGETISHNFMRSWTEIVGHCLMNNIKPVLSTHKHNTFVSKTSVLSIDIQENAPFSNKLEYDYIIFMKTNCLINMNDVKKMIDYDLDVLSCLAPNNFNLQQTNYIEKFDLSKVNTNKYEYGKMQDVDELLKNAESSSLLKVDYFDFNVVCIKKGVLEKMKLPWFNYDETVNDITGDIYFCNKCKENNIDLFVDLKLAVNSEKNVIC